MLELSFRIYDFAILQTANRLWTQSMSGWQPLAADRRRGERKGQVQAGGVCRRGKDF